MLFGNPRENRRNMLWRERQRLDAQRRRRMLEQQDNMAIEFRDVERQLREEAIRGLSEQAFARTFTESSSADSLSIRDLERARRMMMGVPRGRFSDGMIPQNPYGPMIRRQLRLRFNEGNGVHEINLQTDVPRDMPSDYWARQFADQVYRLLRDFPRNWSTVEASRQNESRDNRDEEVSDSEPYDNGRIGAAFE